CDQVLPFQCTSSPRDPQAQTSLALVPQIACSGCFQLVVVGDHSRPFQWTSAAVPPAGTPPEAQMSSGPLPQMPLSPPGGAFPACDQPRPSQWKIAVSPTAQTS